MTALLNESRAGQDCLWGSDLHGSNCKMLKKAEKALMGGESHHPF